VSLILFLFILTGGLIKNYLARPVYPELAPENPWPPEGCLVDASAMKNRALVEFPGGTTVAAAVRFFALEVDPLGSGFCLPRAGVLLRTGTGWSVRPMTQRERWVWRIPMDVHRISPNDLSRINGIGPSLGHRIHTYIRERKCLESLDDLLDVPGIGPARLEVLKKELALN
jgi:competence protein ComEA